MEKINRNKKIRGSVFVIVLTLNILLGACNLQLLPTGDPNTQTVTSLNTIRIGVDAILPPFEVTDSVSNDLVGFDIDLIKTVAAQAGLNVEFVNNSYSQIITMVGKCQIDAAISAIANTDVLKQHMNFSDNYFTTSNVLVVKKSNITVTSLDTLTGLTVGTQSGSPGELESRKISGVLLKTYPSFGLAFLEMVSGYTQAVIADKPHALIYVDSKPNNLKIIGEGFGSVNYTIAICNKRGDLVDSFNLGLKTVKEDGTLEKLSKKWLINVGQ